ncbi:MAG: thiolase family protein, partial [Deltaproteobacteria bacterium]|nr:thiolase family protein [Deltaproteobacteria bacterium]
MREVVVVSAARTAVGKAKRGNLKDTRTDTMMGAALQEAVKRAGGFDPSLLDDVVVGTAFPEAEQGMNTGRIASFIAGFPNSVPALTVNRFCSSGLQSLAQGAAAILAGWQNLVITGGVESMTQIAMGGQKPSPNPELMAKNPIAYASMGLTSENVAERFDVSREAQDAFALESHRRAVAAIEAGRFKDEIFPLATRVFRDDVWHDVVVDTDEGPRAGGTLEALAKLRPVFKVDGTTTAGNASQVSDGAAAQVIASREYAEANGLPILAVLRSYQVVGVDPDIMGVGPRYAIPKALEAAGMSIDDIEVFEINEAFASQAVYCVRELALDPEKVNRNGGAIALGHPLGCTG